MRPNPKKQLDTFVEIFGIAIGDRVTTSYNTGPYKVVDIGEPHYTSELSHYLFVRTWSVINLLLLKDGENVFSFINSVRREGSHWYTDNNNEIFVTKTTAEQLSIFDTVSYPEPVAEPYKFDPEINYVRDAWHCKKCKKDFNYSPPEPGRAICPYCRDWYNSWRVEIMPPLR